MGLKPWEVDKLTPAEFAGLWKQWSAIHLSKGSNGVDTPSDSEARAVAEAEAMWGEA
jgi:hypothetical protein